MLGEPALDHHGAITDYCPLAPPFHVVRARMNGISSRASCCGSYSLLNSSRLALNVVFSRGDEQRRTSELPQQVHKNNSQDLLSMAIELSECDRLAWDWRGE